MATVKDILLKHFISDVEQCYIETISAVSRRFNMVLLFKENIRHEFIKGINSNNLEDLKEQLSICNSNIKFAEGLPLNWSQIMKEVRENPREFSEAGGWDCLTATRNTELVIKMEMESAISLSCCSCKEKVPTDHDDIEERNYTFYCRNCPQSASLSRNSQRGEKTVGESEEDSNKNQTEREVENVEKSPISREFSSSSRQMEQEILKDLQEMEQEISVNYAGSEDKERTQERAPSSSFCEQSTESEEKSSADLESSKRNPEAEETSVQNKDKRGDTGPPAKKYRMEEATQTEGESASLCAGSGGQRTSTSPGSPISRTVKEKELLLGSSRSRTVDAQEEERQGQPRPGPSEEAVRTNNNIPGPLIPALSGGDKTPPASQTPTPRGGEGGRGQRRRNLTNLELLVHANQCEDNECDEPKCRKMKGLVGHIRKRRHSANCTTCPPMIRLLAHHARICQEAECSVPECQSLKQRFTNEV